jgi:hypothetical protein
MGVIGFDCLPGTLVDLATFEISDLLVSALILASSTPAQSARSAVSRPPAIIGNDVFMSLQVEQVLGGDRVGMQSRHQEASHLGPTYLQRKSIFTYILTLAFFRVRPPAMPQSCRGGGKPLS